ncbi:alanine--tRNA ligase [Candidatus Hepatobacter penaei]|uniref:alanine--tRNA ligase n=1 Tax=Candidatus Hepatobacter penaei TaxID=1274402 RepID=UPI0004F2BF46|nr:alanine--tRNA ligase [Candidatus Hepatobacter penaei]
MQTAAVLRQTFLDFFKTCNHAIVPSVPLVPQDDPSLLFVNAGMVPFKRVFMGDETRPFTKAASAQKCVRAGGKHNDLDMVGYTKRHHTFFEMLGNFSFGDYFKEEAIVYAWTFLTQTLGLDPARLWITVYPTDTEARRLWRKVTGFTDDRILSIEGDDNFWSMGETGPCGPCTEIFYDHGAHLPGGLPGTADEDGGRFVEIWNLVFMQFDQKKDGTQSPLPHPGVDTGIGLERLAAVMQGTDDNYETDIFLALKKKISDVLSYPQTPQHHASFNVIADHVRAGAFLMADGVVPSIEGRGYVLRRILRRAMRHGTTLGARTPFLADVFPALVSTMGASHGELAQASSFITTTLTSEEKGFAETLDRGEGVFQKKIADLAPGGTLKGEDAFLLYDTYGLPVDVLEDLLAEKQLTFDRQGFDEALSAQKKRARLGQRFTVASSEGVYTELQKALPPSAFVGHDAPAHEATLRAIVVDGQRVDEVAEGQAAQLVFDATPFYGEAGGQQGDCGTLEGEEGGRAEVVDTQVAHDLILHHARMVSGRFRVGQRVRLVVDESRRQALAVHHSATHLLHAALRRVLGDHVIQKGSLVTPSRLRFDFSHQGALTPDQCMRIEAMVNAHIREAKVVHTHIMTPEAAREGGAMALFGERYGDQVRVVSMGDEALPFSKELCGGTHVCNTGELGFFKIVSQSGVAKGVRRIEACAAEAAEDYVRHLDQVLGQAKTLLGASLETLTDKIDAVLQEKKALGLRAKQGPQTSATDIKEATATTPSGIFLCVRHCPGMSMDDLRVMVDKLRDQNPVSVLVMLAPQGGKTSVVLGVQGALLDAPSLLKTVFTSFDGRGGGKASLAQGACVGEPSSDEVLKALKDTLSSMHEPEGEGVL